MPYVCLAFMQKPHLPIEERTKITILIQKIVPPQLCNKFQVCIVPSALVQFNYKKLKLLRKRIVSYPLKQMIGLIMLSYASSFCLLIILILHRYNRKK